MQLSARCDGSVDCPGGDDELDCAPCDVSGDAPIECHVTRTCIAASMRCNGERDCQDGEDESGCDGPSQHHSAESPGGGGSDVKSRAGTFALVSSVLTAVVIVFVVILYCQLRRKHQPEPLGNTDVDMVHKPFIQYHEAEHNNLAASQQSDSTWSTRTSNGTVSVLTSGLRHYDRNRLTGASSVASSTTSTQQYPQETLNPPPSLVTSHMTGDGHSGYTSSSSQGTIQSMTPASMAVVFKPSSAPHKRRHHQSSAAAAQKRAARKHYKHHHHHFPHHKRKHGGVGTTMAAAAAPLYPTPCGTDVGASSAPLYTTPCGTDVGDDSEMEFPPHVVVNHSSVGADDDVGRNVGGVGSVCRQPPQQQYYQVLSGDSNYDSDTVTSLGPTPSPTPTPVPSLAGHGGGGRSYFSDDVMSGPPSPLAESRYFLNPPPCPVYSD